jgi:hypothetical protein
MAGHLRISTCEWTTFPTGFDEDLVAYRRAGAREWEAR